MCHGGYGGLVNHGFLLRIEQEEHRVQEAGLDCCFDVVGLLMTKKFLFACRIELGLPVVLTVI